MPINEQYRDLTANERKQIEELLLRRSNEIATFLGDYMRDSNHFGSVELALRREVDRLRRLASRVCPPDPVEEDDDA